ncbi:MAG: FKBP-type peptidyl-prolyl cis-trans isomerase, partial [Clostridia bacterium]|nr:FKBP-type peptidyl-prolyl cis-trans isomerase [Clostridia bacterium]
MRKTATILILLALVLIISSCGKSDKPSDTTAGATTTGEVTTDYFNNLSDDDPVPISEYVYEDYLKYLDVSEVENVVFNIDEVNSEIEAYLEDMLESFKGNVFIDPPEGYAAKSGDMVSIYYTGYSASEDLVIDEDTLANMTNTSDDEPYYLKLGSGSFIGAYESEEHPEKNNPGFEEQLVGLKAGESKTIKVTFPDGYNEILGGQEIYFDVDIVAIQMSKDPTELNDDLVTQYTDGELNTIEELRNYLETYYKGEMAYNKISEKITVIAYPEGTLENYINEYVKSYLISYYGESATEADADQDELANVKDE